MRRTILKRKNECFLYKDETESVCVSIVPKFCAREVYPMDLIKRKIHSFGSIAWLFSAVYYCNRQAKVRGRDKVNVFRLISITADALRPSPTLSLPRGYRALVQRVLMKNGAQTDSVSPQGPSRRVNHDEETKSFCSCICWRCCHSFSF
jgi:hypothetical protein